MSNSIRQRLNDNTALLQTKMRQDHDFEHILEQTYDDIETIRRKHRDRMLLVRNPNGILTNIIFTDGTAFSNG